MVYSFVCVQKQLSTLGALRQAVDIIDAQCLNIIHSLSYRVAV